MRSAAQDPALLGLELILGEDPPGAKVGQAFELGGGRRCGGPRRAPMEHALLVPLTLLVDCLLDVLGLADVLEHLAAPLARGLDDEVTRPDHPLEDALVEPHVVQGLGISIEDFAIQPCRWITRSEVTTKWEVR